LSSQLLNEKYNFIYKAFIESFNRVEWVFDRIEMLESLLCITRGLYAI